MDASDKTQRTRILLADDHETVREGLKAIFRAQPDMEVVGEAADGRATISEAIRLTPDVVVMDVSLPIVNGMQATAQIRQCCPSVRVLALTRHAEDEFLQQLLRAGAAGYVLKQSRATELLHGIRAVAAGGTYLDPTIAGRAIDRRRRPAQAGAEGALSLPSLSPREDEVLRLVAWGYSNKEIAARLDLSVKTIETHKANATYKLHLRNRIDVVRFALTQGWLQDS